MNQQRRAEYKKCRDEIAAWQQDYAKVLAEVATTGGALPSYKAPPPFNDAYHRVLSMITEDRVSGGAFDSLPPGDLTIASAITVIEGIDVLLAATREP
jgi:hypothetical protein